MPPIATDEINPKIEIKPPTTERRDNRSDFRFSGHQTFPLRLSWFPKAIKALADGIDPFADIDSGITRLGLGKNMVEALRCWIEAFQVAVKTEKNWKLTPVGELIFDRKRGLDPFIDEHSTAWLLHWLICSNQSAPFFAWECLFNRWHSPDFTASQVLAAFKKESDSSKRPASAVTLRQHWEVFIHSYRPPRNGKGEDHLDCVLSQIRLVVEAGERQGTDGRIETRYEFDMSPKTSISNQFFAFTIHDWWNKTSRTESTVRLADVVFAHGSPGRLLKMAEREIIRRMEYLGHEANPDFEITESANQRVVTRRKESDGFKSLTEAYQNPIFI